MMKKYFLVIFVVLVLAVIGYLVTKKYVNPKILEINISSIHPGLEGIRLEDEKAWRELVSRTELEKMDVIIKGNEVINIDSAVNKLELIVSDEEQPYFVINNGNAVYSSADVFFEKKVLTVLMFINEDFIEDDHIESLIHDTIWQITRAYHEKNVDRIGDFNQKLQDSREYFIENNYQLVTR